MSFKLRKHVDQLTRGRYVRIMRVLKHLIRTFAHLQLSQRDAVMMHRWMKLSAAVQQKVVTRRLPALAPAVEIHDTTERSDVPAARCIPSVYPASCPTASEPE